jgi:hypothetical protein
MKPSTFGQEWPYSAVHHSARKVIEEQTLWGQVVCRVWLPNQDAVVRVPRSSAEVVSRGLSRRYTSRGSRAPRHPSRSGEHPKAVPHRGRMRQPIAPDAPSFQHRHTQAGPGAASWPCFRGSRGYSGLFQALPEPVGAIFRPE